jgi:hypothetical protein
LFVLGILLAHGALAAGWMAQDAPRQRDAVVSTCARELPTQPLHIAPPRELLAQVSLQSSAQSGVLRP